ncbi:YeeE/YedE family protein [Paracoccus sp. DMF-8]|uniref:YeeE/YedE family protein n=1 Tax=Paracoccus sp. DMF-8 TaxID=3019445 RepID=UPI0023E84402|nr:YeeE/YedE family protein [Paracoccus sp. DMF-8]MDF3605735.1 YeeE/YedE family protein [Paracoccus sp. DMF-8]
MTEFTPWASLAGGALIGLAAVLLMALHGRIAGISGILTGILPPVARDWGWRAAFLLGAVLAPAGIVGLGATLPFDSPVPAFWVVTGGFVAGIGVQLGGGCTSGHGVCGLARLSRRSIAATLVFMLTTAVTVYVIRHVMGGW